MSSNNYNVVFGPATFLAEEVATEYVIADFAELCNKRFSSKSICDALNDCRHFSEKSLAFMRERTSLILDVQRTSSAKF